MGSRQLVVVGALRFASRQGLRHSSYRASVPPRNAQTRINHRRAMTRGLPIARKARGGAQDGRERGTLRSSRGCGGDEVRRDKLGDRIEVRSAGSAEQEAVYQLSTSRRVNSTKREGLLVERGLLQQSQMLRCRLYYFNNLPSGPLYVTFALPGKNLDSGSNALSLFVSL